MSYWVKITGLPWGLSGKEPACQDVGLVPWSGRSPGVGNANPLQYSCLGNPMHRGAWQVTWYMGSQKSWTWLSYSNDNFSFPKLLALCCLAALPSATNHTSVPTSRPKRLCLVASVISDSLRPHGPWPTRLLCPWNFPSKNTGVGWHFLLHGIFLAQGLNPSLLHWQIYSLPFSHLGSPRTE